MNTRDDSMKKGFEILYGPAQGQVVPVTAVYAGSFDPPTLGHLDIIDRASSIFPELAIAIGVNSSKKSLFDIDEKKTMLNTALCQRSKLVQTKRNITICTFDDMLLVDFCRQIGAKVLVRGLRAASDFDYELFMAQANASQTDEVQTVWLPTNPQYSFVSSSVVKEIARLGGDVTDYVDRAVELRLYEKFGRNSSGKKKT